MPSENPADAFRQAANQPDQRLLGELEQAERHQAWDRVEALCKQILQADSDHWNIWQRLALSHEAREDWTQAETLWRHLSQRFSQRPEPYLALAALQRKRGAPEAARAVLQQAERRLGRSPELAASIKVIDDPWVEDDSVPSLDEGATAAAIAGALHRAQDHLNSGRHAEAEATLEQLVKARPQTLQFHRALAELRTRREDYRAVIQQLSPVIQKGVIDRQLAKQMDCALLLVRALEQVNQWEALQTLAPALVEQAPQEARWLLLQARCLMRNGEDVQALPLIQRCLDLNPRLSGAELAMGELQARLGDWEEAIASLERSLALQPGNETAAAALERARQEQQWQRGEAALARADWERAERHFRALLELGDQGRALARLELLASLDARKVNAAPEEQPNVICPASQRLEQFSRWLDRIEQQLTPPGAY